MVSMHLYLDDILTQQLKCRETQYGEQKQVPKPLTLRKEVIRDQSLSKMN